MDSILSGRQPILEALKSGVALEKILVLYGTRGESLRQIRALAKQRGVPLSEVSKHPTRRIKASSRSFHRRDMLRSMIFSTRLRRKEPRLSC